MLCCAGLFGGLYIGQQLGGPWTYIAPAAGFGLGLIGDMKFMHKVHNPSKKNTDEDESPVQRSNEKPDNAFQGRKQGASENMIRPGTIYTDRP